MRKTLLAAILCLSANVQADTSWTLSTIQVPSSDVRITTSGAIYSRTPTGNLTRNGFVINAPWNASIAADRWHVTDDHILAYQEQAMSTATGCLLFDGNIVEWDYKQTVTGKRLAVSTLAENGHYAYKYIKRTYLDGTLQTSSTEASKNNGDPIVVLHTSNHGGIFAGQGFSDYGTAGTYNDQMYIYGTTGSKEPSRSTVKPHEGAALPCFTDITIQGLYIDNGYLIAYGNQGVNQGSYGLWAYNLQTSHTQTVAEIGHVDLNSPSAAGKIIVWTQYYLEQQEWKIYAWHNGQTSLVATIPAADELNRVRAQRDGSITWEQDGEIYRAVANFPLPVHLSSFVVE